LEPFVAAPLLARELEDIVKNRAPVQLAMKAIEAREESVQSLFAMGDYLVE